jgi:hypothetical protein
MGLRAFPVGKTGIAIRFVEEFDIRTIWEWPKREGSSVHVDWRKFVKIAELVGPIALAAAGVPPTATALVIHGIQIAEQVGEAKGLSGAQKKEIAMDAVTTGLAAVNAARPGTVSVPELTGVVSEGIDLTVKAIQAGKNIPLAPEQLPGQVQGGPI